jgi:hypothetical protein
MTIQALMNADKENNPHIDNYNKIDDQFLSE